MNNNLIFPKVTIVIITFNNREIIGENLDSIKNLNYQNYECFVVDDCSTDGTCEYVKEKYPWVKIIKKHIKSGIGTSKNIGLEQSESEYILYLDSDVSLHEDYLNECVKLMEENKNIVICGGKLLFSQEPDKINEAGGYIYTTGMARDRGQGENSQMYNNIEEVFYIGGAAQCFRRDLFDKIGNFDITTSYYGAEDIDICWRARLAGYMVFYNHLALGYHGYHQTIKKLKQDKLMFSQTKAQIRMIIKNYGLTNLARYLPLAFLISMGDIILFKESRIAKIKAWGWNIANLKDTLKERKRIQSTRKIKDEEILKYMNKNIGKLVFNRIRKINKIKTK